MSIVVKGDTHGNMEEILEIEKQFHLTEKDYIIIAGDYGLLFSEKYFQAKLEILKKSKCTILWVDGNHENHSWIDSLPVEEWNGGKVHKLPELPRCIHLMRGQVFNIEGDTYFTFGGANSIDKWARIPFIDWWAREMPSEAEYNEGLANLAKCNNKVDYIITHACSTETMYLINPTFKVDAVNKYLSEIEKTVEFKKWYFGHYHEDKQLTDKHFLLYKETIRIK